MVVVDGLIIKPINLRKMKNSILKLGNALNKVEQKQINGGSRCNHLPSKCIACGGHPKPNGCCFGGDETHLCLNGFELFP